MDRGSAPRLTRCSTAPIVPSHAAQCKCGGVAFEHVDRGAELEEDVDRRDLVVHRCRAERSGRVGVAGERAEYGQVTDSGRIEASLDAGAGVGQGTGYVGVAVVHGVGEWRSVAGHGGADDFEVRTRGDQGPGDVDWP